MVTVSGYEGWCGVDEERCKVWCVEKTTKCGRKEVVAYDQHQSHHIITCKLESGKLAFVLLRLAVAAYGCSACLLTTIRSLALN